MNDNIKIVLDQILQGLENLNSKLNEPQSPKENPILNGIEDRLKSIEEHESILNKNIVNLGNSQLKLSRTILSFKPINETKIEYNHVFFPVMNYLAAS